MEIEESRGTPMIYDLIVYMPSTLLPKYNNAVATFRAEGLLSSVG